MYGLFAITFTPKTSAIYLRFILLLSACFLGLILYSSLPFAVKLLLSILSGILVFRSWQEKKPYPNLQTLSFRNLEWILQFSDRSDAVFTKAELFLYTGYFFLLRFDDKKTLIFFGDQLNVNERRNLQFYAMRAVYIRKKLKKLGRLS